MTDQGILRCQGDFPNKRTVEYATVFVDLAHKLLPANLQNPHYADDDLVAGLYVSPAGRLTFNILYLDDLALAQRFAAHVDRVFSARNYAGRYALRVEVTTTTQTVTATKKRLQHSAAVRQILSTDSILV
ncbi:hypothetical protein JHZ66_25005 [Pseudomonas cannabina pv. alisalensis]|uniref:Uncharacterized protein n=2 Tax=Pseudomonas cannabina TaxID=86840 RepID=A0ABS1XKJ4_PSEC1|nr:hypothetical protein [Pseudomonas cannabina pv. alisalensis]